MPRLLPFDYIDKLCFAGTRAPWASNAPTWRLYLRGSITEPALRTAVGQLLARYPALASRVVSLAGPMERARHFAWSLDDAPDVARALAVADLRAASAAERAQAEQSFADRYLDLETDYPFLVTWVRLPDEGGQEHSALFLQQHHGIADGRAFLDVCRDLVVLLDCALRGVAPPPGEPFVEKLPERAAVTERGPAAFLRGLGCLLFEGLRGLAFPPAPLLCNVGRDYSGRNRTRFVLVPEERVERWRGARTALGLSSNDLFTAALVAALARWSARAGVPPGRGTLLSIVDTRPRDRPFRSFANHLSSFLLTCDLGRGAAVLDLARTLSRQSRYQARHRLAHKKLLVAVPVARAIPIHRLRAMVFDQPRLVANHTFSNLVALGIPGAGPDGRWRGLGFEVDALRITTPCSPPQGANTTVVKYGGTLCFNFNYKDSVLDDTLAGDLCAAFEEALAEIDRALDVPAALPGPAREAVG